jgi:hypothetical protein
VVDVRQHHRPPLRRHPTREARAHRDPHPLLDLLLDPHRRPRDQLVRLLVQQQNRERIHLQNRPDPPQQLPQQILQLQMRQGGVGDRLELLEALGVGAGVHGRRSG